APERSNPRPSTGSPPVGDSRPRRPAGLAPAVSCPLLAYGHPRGEELRFATAELRSHGLVRGAKDLAGDNGRGHQRLHEMADVGEVLQRRVGVSIPLEDDRLALIVVEEHLVLKGAWVSGPHDLHGFLRQAFPLVKLAGTDPDACDPLDLLHQRPPVDSTKNGDAPLDQIVADCRQRDRHSVDSAPVATGRCWASRSAISKTNLLAVAPGPRADRGPSGPDGGSRWQSA